ncbi:DNA repair protein RadA [Candidatus Oleimmundimicrobium sp.]|uniref:DNA repair protein RadA n=1 Tax=Candidatus Oleimmundimicrobium sp. TaxID=3060597 RepID=UPI0027224F0E|nr:DNA repair protein RadA [Candidatus Oleimmundimicrobium sp.]MDO8885983.1 DNA repair protein RadA [Candidatus Oleimmundimicrobium sp.]
MRKTQTIMRCQECGYTSLKWLGRCPDCGEWNTIVEESVAKTPKSNAFKSFNPAQDIISIKEAEKKRLPTQIPELDRVLGGGIVDGSLVLLGGVPGVGKSTLLLQVSNSMALSGNKVLIVSGEESAKQIKMRSNRLGQLSPNLFILCETDFDYIQSQIEEINPALLIIDSIQTMFCSDISSSPGSVSQVREFTGRLLRIAKTKGLPTFIVGHVTKDGSIAGPKILEHIVDTVLYFEGDTHRNYRVVRAVKNRFGSTNEVGIFEMTSKGLTEVVNPSALFLAERPTDVPGSIVVVTMEGNRPLLVELQGLTSSSYLNIPRRLCSGLDFNRLSLVLAVLEKKMGHHLEKCDVYVNITGGIKVVEPAADLGIALVVASSYLDKKIPADVAAFGEIGLAGEVRFVSQVEKRLAEAASLGFKRVILPAQDADIKNKGLDIELLPVKNVREALKYLN